MTSTNDAPKYCFEITFNCEWRFPRTIYVVAETMEEACKHASEKKNWQQEIESCKVLGRAP